MSDFNAGSMSDMNDRDSVGGIDSDTDQYLTFMLANEEYGVDILRVQEIKGWDTVTHIPNTPDYIKGVLNLRGTIVPIIDLRLRFGLDPIPYGATTVIVVVRVMDGEKTRTMGVVVDGVSDVYDISPESISPTPEFGGSIKTGYLKGMATLDEKMVIILDIDFLCSGKELENPGQPAAA